MTVLDVDSKINEAEERAQLYAAWVSEGVRLRSPEQGVYDWLVRFSPTFRGSTSKGPITKEPTILEEKMGLRHEMTLIDPVAVATYISWNPENSTSFQLMFKCMHAIFIPGRCFVGANIDESVRMYSWLGLVDVGKDGWPDWLVDRSSWEIRSPFRENVTLVLQNCYWPGKYSSSLIDAQENYMRFTS